MLDCKPISTPMEPDTRLYAEESRELKNTTMYKKLVKV
jgi:hypothetical protein